MVAVVPLLEAAAVDIPLGVVEVQEAQDVILGQMEALAPLEAQEVLDLPDPLGLVGVTDLPEPPDHSMRLSLVPIIQDIFIKPQLEIILQPVEPTKNVFEANWHNF